MNYSETVTSFSCVGQQLQGILTRPETAGSTGVIVIVGGPQYRAGSHRQFVLLARRLAAAGYPVLRFDYRGMGDSEGPKRDFEDVSADVGAAMDALCASLPEVQRVVLWGLCDGASAALLYCLDSQDTRVGGLCLLNPWVRSQASLARTQVKHYYLQRLGQKEFWAKLVSGKVALGAVTGLGRNLLAAFSGPGTASSAAKLSFQARMAQAWKGFQRPVLLMLSGDDYTAKEFLEYAQASADWAGALDLPWVQRRDMPGADHTCSSAEWRALAENGLLEWLALR